MGLFDILFLYIAFRIKHFICDFLLQNLDFDVTLFSKTIHFRTNWLLLKECPDRVGVKALIVHSLIHGLGTFLIMLLMAPSFWWLSLVDFLIHMTIDKIKGALKYKNDWGFTDKAFWISLGLDQEAHNFTHLAFIVIIVSGYSLT